MRLFKYIKLLDPRKGTFLNAFLRASFYRLIHCRSRTDLLAICDEAQDFFIHIREYGFDYVQNDMTRRRLSECQECVVFIKDRFTCGYIEVPWHDEEGKLNPVMGCGCHMLLKVRDPSKRCWKRTVGLDEGWEAES